MHIYIYTHVDYIIYICKLHSVANVCIYYMSTQKVYTICVCLLEQACSSSWFPKSAKPEPRTLGLRPPVLGI